MRAYRCSFVRSKSKKTFGSKGHLDPVNLYALCGAHVIPELPSAS